MYYCHIADTPSAAFLKRGSDQKKTKYTSHTAYGMLGSCPFLIGMTLTTLIDKIFLMIKVYYIHTYLLFMYYEVGGTYQAQKNTEPSL